MSGMPPSPRSKPIATWQAGEAVQGFALLRKREVRQDKGGRDYLDLELADASGALPAKAWSDSQALAAEVEVYDFVKFRGQVQSFREQLQLKVDHLRRAVEEDRAEGFDEALLVPATHEDLDDLWSRLDGLLRAQLERPMAQRLAGETLAVYGERLRVHPAAKAIHHAYLGGLLEHVVSMAELAVRICDHYRELDRDLVILGVLFHDLGKLEELGAMPRNDYTPVGRLVGHIVIGRDLVRERTAAIEGFPEELRLQLEHLVLSHQGRKEFGSPVEPMTPEAIALHMIDDLDSKLAVLRGLRQQAQAPGFTWARSLDRFVWLAEASGSPPAAGEAAEADNGPAGTDAPGENGAEPPSAPQKKIW